jgi:hypothetical protein
MELNMETKMEIYTLIDVNSKEALYCAKFKTLKEFLIVSAPYRNKNTFIVRGEVIMIGDFCIGVECFGVDFKYRNTKFTNDQMDALFALREQFGFKPNFEC